jgi:DHA1 family tetracycline resistance protein-like MFS transporter
MFSEGILVRLAVPRFGEMGCIRIGLLAYAAQCATIAFASNIQMIFFSLLFSMLANLVYPSVSSLVVKVVGSHEQGEALGALNGVKAMVSRSIRSFNSLTFNSLIQFNRQKDWVHWYSAA